MALLDFNALKNKRRLAIEIQLLIVITNKVNADNTIKFEQAKKTLADAIKRSPQNVGAYLKKLVECNAIKYKYSGLIFLNPEFCYNGDAKDFELTMERYNSFKSDM